MSESSEAQRGKKAKKAERKGPRKPRKVTAERLERQALAHLERYASSSRNLADLLRRKAARSRAYHGADSSTEELEALKENHETMIGELIAKLLRLGLLDDQAYADSLARRYNRSGLAKRAIAQRLAAKGIDKNQIERALSQLDEAQEDSDLMAAIGYAKRRRLGAFRTDADRREMAQKDLAALARRGFSYDVARRVLEAEEEDLLELWYRSKP